MVKNIIMVDFLVNRNEAFEGVNIHNSKANIIRQLSVPEVHTSLSPSILAYPEGLPEGYARIRGLRLVWTEGTESYLMYAMKIAI